jgi:hypothetical protein
MVLFSLVICGMVISFSIPAFGGEGWVTYRSEEYGFSMLVPEGTKFEEKEFEGGWGALYANYQGVKLWAVGKLGAPEEAKDIEAYGVKVTGIPAKYWKTIDKGKNAHGWKWYNTVKASDGKTIAYGGYGIGPKGSYMLILVTSKQDFEENNNDYLKWYKSIRLL